MATYYWVGGSGGNWSDSTKWSLTSGGAGGAGVPGSADTAIVNGASLSANSTITVDTVTTVTTFTISAVDVMVTLASAGNLTVTGTCAISVLNAIQSYGLTISGDVTFGALTLTSGTLSLGSSNITVNGIVTISGTVARTLAFGTGSINIVRTTTSSITIWSGATLTACTITGSKNVTFNLIGTAFTYDTTITHGTTGGNGSNAINITSLTSTVPGSSVVIISGHYNDFNLGSFQKVLGNSTRTIYGSITLNSNTTLTGGLSVTTISNNGVDKTITSNGVAFNFPITINSAGLEKIILADAMTIASPRTLTLTAGYIDLNGFTLTCYAFSSSGSSTRGIDFSYNAVSDTFGNMVINAGTITGATTIWNCATITNMTLTNSRVSVIVNAATTQTATINHGGTAGNTTSNRLNITGFTTNSSAVVVSTTGHYGDVILNDPSGALRVTNGVMSVYYALTVGSNTIVNASTSVLTLNNASITTNGVALNFPVTVVNGATLLDACTLGNTRAFTLTSGALWLNGFTLTTGLMVGTGSTTRRIDFDGGNIAVNASLSGATTVWSFATLTNFSYTGTWNVSYNVAGNFRAVITHGPTGANVSNAYPALVNPTVAGELQVTGHYIDVDLSGISNTIVTPGFTVYRDLKFSSTSTLTETINEINFVDATYTKTLTLNGNLLRSNLGMNAAGATLLFNDAFQSDKSIALKAGTLDANGFNVTTRSFTLGVSAGAKTLNMGSGLWTINGSTSTVTGDIYTWVPWDVATNSANPSFTFNKGTANILLLAFANSHNISFYGGGQTYNKVSMGGDFTGSVVTFFNDSTYNELESLKTVPFTLRFDGGTNNTINNWNVNGTASNQVTLTTRLAGVHTLTKASGTVITNYLTISNSVAAGGATWRAPTNYGNVDGGGNSGWDFSPLVSAGVNSNFFVFF